MSLKTEKINELATQYSIPRDLVDRAVDDNGVVNSAVLGAVLQGYKAGVSGRTVQNDELITALYAALAEAKEKKDVVGMIRLKGSLEKLGVNPNFDARNL